MRWWYQLNRREPHYVTNENIGEAKDALRDILYVYHQALTSRQLDVELDLGTFDALEYIDCVMAPSPGSSLAIDSELLREGSAFVLVAELDCAWDFGRADGIEGHERALEIRAASDALRLEWVPDCRAAVEATFVDYATFQRSLARVYQRCVLGHFVPKIGRVVSTGTKGFPR